MMTKKFGVKVKNSVGDWDYYIAEIYIEDDKPGYHAFCPLLKGLHVGGNTVEDTIKNAKDALNAYIDSLLRHKEPLPLEKIDSLDLVPA